MRVITVLLSLTAFITLSVLSGNDLSGLCGWPTLGWVVELLVLLDGADGVNGLCRSRVRQAKSLKAWSIGGGLSGVLCRVPTLLTRRWRLVLFWV